MDAKLAQRLERLLDRSEIEQTIHRYYRGLDRVDPVLQVTSSPDDSRTVRGRRDRSDPSYR